MTRRKPSDAPDAPVEQRGRDSGEVEDSVLDRSVISGQMVKTPDAETAYKVVLDHADGRQTEHPVRTMQEGEAFIKRRMPRAKPRDRSRDRAAGTA